jgi:signal transduction histidine kinase
MNSQLLADIRHDLKSPLAGVKALCQMAVRSLEKNEILQAKEMMIRLDGRLDEMVKIINTQIARLEEK